MASDLAVNIVIGAALAASHKRTLDTAKRGMKGYASGIGSAIRQHRIFQSVMGKTDRMKRAAAKRDEAGARLAKQRMKALGALAAMYAVGRMAASAAATEEQGLYLRTVINAKDGNKDAAVGRSMAHARKFARSSLASDKEVLDIEYNLNSAGLSEEVSRSGSELVHKLAKVTKGVPAQVGKIFGTTFNNLGGAMVGTTEEKMNRIADALAKTQFKFQFDDFNQLGQSMAYASATIASANIQFEQSAAALGLLNTAGLEGSRAGTAFTAMMNKMGKASAEMDFDMVRSADGTLDLIATLEGLNGTLDGMDIDEKSQKLLDLFDVQGKEAIIPLLSKLDELKQGTTELGESGGLVEKSYNRFLKSSSGQAKMFGQNLKMVGDVFAGTLLPAINAVLTPIAKMLGFVAMAVEKFPILGWVLGAVGAGLTAMATAQLVATTAQWALNEATLAWPVMWIIGAVVGIVAAIGLLWKNWDTVKEKLGQAWEAFKSFAVKVGKLFLKFNPLGLMIKQVGWVGKAPGRLFGGKKALAGAAASASMAASPLPAMADLPPVAGAGGPPAKSIAMDARATFNIVQQPGESGEDLGKRIDAVFTEKNRLLLAEQREALYD